MKTSLVRIPRRTAWNVLPTGNWNGVTNAAEVGQGRSTPSPLEKHLSWIHVVQCYDVTLQTLHCWQASVKHIDPLPTTAVTSVTQ